MKALDGLRGISILLVLAFHILHLPGGYIGVDVFFVISGFLITNLFVVELRMTGRIDLRSFFVRRALRLMPALWVMIAVSLAAARALHSFRLFTMEALEGVTALVYATNWLWVDVGPVYDLFGHTWSLAIEEQFYVLWGATASLLLRRASSRLAFTVLLGTIGLVIAWRAELWMHGASDIRLFVGFDTRLDELLAGCAAAVWASTEQNATAVRKALRRYPQFGLSALIILLAVGCLSRSQNAADYFAWMPVATAASVCLVFEAMFNEGGLISRCLSAPFLVSLGVISYGVYLWHDPLNQFVMLTRYDSWPVRLVVAGCGGTMMAVLSYRFVEKPALLIRHTNT